MERRIAEFSVSHPLHSPSTSVYAVSVPSRWNAISTYSLQLHCRGLVSEHHNWSKNCSEQKQDSARILLLMAKYYEIVSSCQKFVNTDTYVSVRAPTSFFPYEASTSRWQLCSLSIFVTPLKEIIYVAMLLDSMGSATLCWTMRSKDRWKFFESCESIVWRK